jgi:hypothetical protein
MPSPPESYAVLLAIASAPIGSFLLAWGVLRARITDTERHLDKIEHKHDYVRVVAEHLQNRVRSLEDHLDDLRRRFRELEDIFRNR